MATFAKRSDQPIRPLARIEKVMNLRRHISIHDVMTKDAAQASHTIQMLCAFNAHAMGFSSAALRVSFAPVSMLSSIGNPKA